MLSVVMLQSSGGGIMSFLPLVLVAVVFYFFMIRPQMQKSKKQKAFRAAMKKGDRIVTIGGIHGKIKEISDSTILIETEGNSRMRVEKSAISLDFSSGKGEEAAAEIEQNK